MPRNQILHPKNEHDSREHSSEVIVLGAAALITLAVFLVQGIILKFFAHGLTLQADTIHTLSDFLINLGAFFVAWITVGKKDTDAIRIERWFMYLGLVILCAGALWTFLEALERIAAPTELQSGWLILGGLIGGFGNFLAHTVLARIPHEHRTHKHKLVHLHVLEDMVLSGVVVVSGVSGVFFGWDRIDPYLSILAVLWVLKRAYTIARGLKQGVPHSCNHHH
jgi:Co/Zn/Cd efflux system component